MGGCLGKGKGKKAKVFKLNLKILNLNEFKNILANCHNSCHEVAKWHANFRMPMCKAWMKRN